MDILGHGIDVIDIGRVEELLARNNDFLLGWFTSRELSTLEARLTQPWVVAGRVAAKEAVAEGTRDWIFRATCPGRTSRSWSQMLERRRLNSLEGRWSLPGPWASQS